MKFLKKLTIDVGSASPNDIFHLHQNDVGSAELVIKLTENSQELALTGATVKYDASVRNILVAEDLSGSISDNKIHIPVTEQMTQLSGIMLIDVRIIENGETFHTHTIMCHVDSAVVNDGVSVDLSGITIRQQINQITAALALKANSSDVTAALALKANTADVQAVRDAIYTEADVLSDATWADGYYNSATGAVNQTTSTWTRVDPASMPFLQKGTIITVDTVKAMIVGYASQSPNTSTFLWGEKLNDTNATVEGGTFTVPADAYVGFSYGGSVGEAEAIAATTVSVNSVDALQTRADAAETALQAVDVQLNTRYSLSADDFDTGYYNPNTGSVNSTTSSYVKTKAASMLLLKRGTRIVIDNVSCYVVVYSSATPNTSTFLYSLKTADYGYDLTLPTDGYVTLSFGNSLGAEAAVQKTHIFFDAVRFATSSNAVAYVATDGNDTTGDGTAAAPFATMRRALAVASNIIVKAGVYRQAISSTDVRGSVSIAADPARTAGQQVVFDLSETLAFTADGGLISCAYTVGSSDLLKKIFITKDVSPIVGDPVSDADRKKYRVTIWSEDGETLYTPYVGELSDMANGQFTFANDNGTTKFYIKGAAAGNYKLSDRTAGGNVLSIDNAAHVVLSEITFGYCAGNVAVIENCPDFKAIGCRFEHSSTENGVVLNHSSGECINCRAGYVPNDGFSFHDNGTTVLTDCEGHHCLSGDGVSHHECCRAYIHGGRWHHCGKAGISDPTYGALANIDGANVSDNGQFGIQIYYSTPSAALVPSGTTVNVCNCYIHDNPVGIKCVGYAAEVWNCVFVNNSTDVDGVTPVDEPVGEAEV